jgi:hypothetical protein
MPLVPKAQIPVAEAPLAYHASLMAVSSYLELNPGHRVAIIPRPAITSDIYDIRRGRSPKIVYRQAPVRGQK